MLQRKSLILLLLALVSEVLSFAPQSSVCLGPTNVAMIPTSSNGFETVVSKSLLNDVDSLLLSVVQETESVTRQSMIDWDNPGSAILGSITLLYIAFSILAGIKYVVKDGYRPKF